MVATAGLSSVVELGGRVHAALHSKPECIVSTWK